MTYLNALGLTLLVSGYFLITGFFLLPQKKGIGIDPGLRLFLGCGLVYAILGLSSTLFYFFHWPLSLAVLMPPLLIPVIYGLGRGSFLTDVNNLPFKEMLLFLGMFLEVISIMLITLPIILPVLEALGIDLVHFAIVMTVNMEVALITPPVGLNLYVLTSVAKSNLSEVIRGAFPFVVLSLTELAIITYWPDFTLYLPRLLMSVP